MRAAGLDDGGGAGLGGGEQAVGEREEGVGGDDRALGQRRRWRPRPRPRPLLSARQCALQSTRLIWPAPMPTVAPSLA